ncbi:MAG TPA: GDP-mannose 4,6-dehydratase [Verrucomicrobiaceae bacterium]|jgi:GDPmannose 4,6-dehydratase
MKKVLITGITGQDGSYLTEYLLGKGYEVHGVLRRSSMFNRGRIEHLRQESAASGRDLSLHYADLTDHTTIRRIIQRVHPVELYHLAGQSHVGLSFEIPESTVQEIAASTLALLEVCRDMDAPPRIYHAASSEVFGSPAESPQTEETPFRPVNPYGCAKAFAANLCRVYREAHGLYVCSGIAYNHESPRRGENFVTRKITAAAARIAAGSSEVLELGNLDSQRDWGWAPEYVKCMWHMLQQQAAEDYVLATGVLTTVREFAMAAFAALGISLTFHGAGLDETAHGGPDGRCMLRINPRFHRPLDAAGLVGNSSRAQERLGWSPKIHGVRVAEQMALADSAKE